MVFNPNQSIVERHARRLLGLEDTQAKIILAQYAKAFTAIKTRLLMVDDNTFTEARLKSTLEQLSLFIDALNRNLKNDINQSSLFSFEQGVEDSVAEINKFEKDFSGVTGIVPLDTIFQATKKRNYLVNQFAGSINSYNESLRSDIQQSLTQALIQGQSYTQVIHGVEKVIQSSMWKTQRIVRTEMHNIYNISKMDGMGSIKKKYVPDLKKMLVHPMDNRTAQDSKDLAKKNPIIDLDKPFKQIFNGNEYIFMAPPNRPNDRAILIPARDKYLESDE